MSFVKLMNFKPQTPSKTPLRERSPSASHLMKFVFSPKKIESTLNVLTYNKSLRKKLNHPRKQPTKKA